MKTFKHEDLQEGVVRKSGIHPNHCDVLSGLIDEHTDLLLVGSVGVDLLIAVRWRGEVA